MNCLACIHAQSYPVLGSPIDCSPPGSSVHGILQARALEWVAISSSRGFSWPRDQTHISCVSCIRRQILYHWAPWKPQELLRRLVKTLVSGPHPQSFWLGRLLVRYDHLHWHHWCSGHELGQTPGGGEGWGKHGVLQSMGSPLLGNWTTATTRSQLMQRLIDAPGSRTTLWGPL